MTGSPSFPPEAASQTPPGGAGMELPWLDRAIGRQYPLSVIIAVLCTFFFLVTAIVSGITGGGGADGLASGLQNPSLDVLRNFGLGGAIPLTSGRIWTLVTACYLHGGLLHLAGNMACLFQLMPAVEGNFGRIRALAIYTIAGICGALASALAGEAYSLGASGALFGLMGSLFVWGWLRRDAYGRALMRSCAIWAGIILALGFFGPPGISNAAHLGGLAGGVLATLVLVFLARRGAGIPGWLGLASVGATGLGLVLGLVMGIQGTIASQTDPEGYATAHADETLAELEMLLERAPDNAPLHALRGLMVLTREEPGSADAAILEFDRAEALGYDSPVLRNGRAWAYYKAGRAADGLADVQKALETAPSDPAILDTRAHIYEATGQRDEAIADYQAALKLNPDQKESQEGLARLNGSN